MSYLSFVLFFLVSLVKSTRGQCVTAVELPEYRVYYGIIQLKLNNSDCLPTCAADVSCVGFDLDTLDPGCFFFSSFETDPEPYYPAFHYIIIRKPDLCTGVFANKTFSPSINQTSTGVKTVSGATTVEDCVESCIRNALCSGVDWMQKNKTCWIVKESSQLMRSDGIYHYDLRNISDVAISTQASLIEITSKVPINITTTDKSALNAPTTDKSALNAPTTDKSALNAPTTAIPGVRRNDSEPMSALALKPEYIVIIALSLACFLMVVIAIVVIVTRRRSRKITGSKQYPVSDTESVGKSYENSFIQESNNEEEAVEKYPDYLGDNGVEESEQTLDMIH